MIVGCTAEKEFLVYQDFSKIVPCLFDIKNPETIETITVEKNGVTIPVARVFLPGCGGYYWRGIDYYLEASKWKNYSGMVIPLRSDTYPQKFEVIIFAETDQTNLDGAFIYSEKLTLSSDKWSDFNLSFSRFNNLELDSHIQPLRIPFFHVHHLKLQIRRIGKDQPDAFIEIGPIVIYKDKSIFHFEYQQ